MANEQYFSRSWALLTKHKGWIKPLLVMAAASMVPIVGGLGNKGYGLEWGRLTAWGIDSAPKQKNVDIGRCIGSGWRGFVVDLGWMLVLMCVSAAIGLFGALMPGYLGAAIAGLLSLVMMIVGAFWGIIMRVAELRAAIYEKIGAGYRLDRVFDMVSRDIRGLLRVLCVALVAGFIIVAVAFAFGLMLSLELVSVMVASQYSFSDAVYAALGAALPGIALTSALFGLVIAFLANAANLIVTTAVGLWMRQYDVPSWGRSEDPLPDTDTFSREEQKVPGPMTSDLGYARRTARHERRNQEGEATIKLIEPDTSTLSERTENVDESVARQAVEVREGEADFSSYGVDLTDEPDERGVEELFSELAELTSPNEPDDIGEDEE